MDSWIVQKANRKGNEGRGTGEGGGGKGEGEGEGERGKGDGRWVIGKGEEGTERGPRRRKGGRMGFRMHNIEGEEEQKEGAEKSEKERK